MSISPKLRVVNAVEQGLNTVVTDIRRVQAKNDKVYYVSTPEGLMLCEITNRKVNYKFALIATEGELLIPKKEDLKDPKAIKIAKEQKKYYAHELIDKPAAHLNQSDADIMSRWRHAVYVATFGKKRKAGYAATVIIFNNTTNDESRITK